MKEQDPTPPAETECLESSEPAGGSAVADSAQEGAAVEAGSDQAAAALHEQLQDRYLRLAAEFENYKKRTARDHQTRVQQANAELLLDLLDVADNFERALQTEHEESLYARGVALIYGQLQGLLERRGVAPLDTEGRKFDPLVHEALLHVPSEDVPAGYVCRELRRGYTLHGRALRPAQVAVSSGPGAGALPDPAPESDEHGKRIESGVKNE